MLSVPAQRALEGIVARLSHWWRAGTAPCYFLRARLLVERRAPDRLPEERLVERVPDRLELERLALERPVPPLAERLDDRLLAVRFAPPDRLLVVRLAPPDRLLVARFAVDPEVDRAEPVAFFAVLFARLVAPIARLVAPLAVRLAVVRARLVVLPANFAPALTALPAGDLRPPAAVVTAARAERTASLPRFSAAA